MTNSFSPIKIDRLRALRDNVLVIDMEFQGRQLSSGIILPSDDGKADGIRPRWGKIYVVGPEQKTVHEGQWICVAHGRWTRGIEIEDAVGVKTLRRVDPQDILLVSDHYPGSDDTVSQAIAG